MRAWSAAQLIDLTRYPIATPDTAAYGALAAECRECLEASGLCLLHEFLMPEALAAMAHEANRLAPGAFRRDHAMAIHGGAPPPGLPADHPRRRRFPFRTGAIAYDEFGPGSAIRALYEWDGLTGFIAAVVGGGPLYRCVDSLASCTVTVLADGDEHGWHYDDNDFVVSLLLQSAAAGGAFEVLPNCRAERGEDVERIGRAFDGEDVGRTRPDLRPGTLSLFRGQRSLHHVTRVSGPTPRLIALFSYDRRPNMRFSDAIRRNVYGRLS
jgi:hypothetical protein